MNYLIGISENNQLSKFDILKERLRIKLLNLGYDYINYRRGILKNANRFTYNLRSITINN